MPEHVHLLISEPERRQLSVAMQMLKQITSHKLRPSGLRRFWQVRYSDFPVWSEARQVEKLRYIHRNPVHRGLVQRPEDWRWSSFLQWATGAEGREKFSQCQRSRSPPSRKQWSWCFINVFYWAGPANSEVAPPLSPRLLRWVSQGLKREKGFRCRQYLFPAFAHHQGWAADNGGMSARAKLAQPPF
jgi:hypothetical protein